jgi:hypothetical protein
MLSLNYLSRVQPVGRVAVRYAGRIAIENIFGALFDLPIVKIGKELPGFP